jgi:hypothetical protein
MCGCGARSPIWFSLAIELSQEHLGCGHTVIAQQVGRGVSRVHPFPFRCCIATVESE